MLESFVLPSLYADPALLKLKVTWPDELASVASDIVSQGQTRHQQVLGIVESAGHVIVVNIVTMSVLAVFPAVGTQLAYVVYARYLV